MALKEYQAKRDFQKTPEPKGGSKTGPDKLPIFVVQKHHASHLHYDVRLEHDGVLISFAVPKKPSTSLQVKRLAIHVEDHPLEYASFEGEIPKGEYGGGQVVIWDKGHYTYPGLADRKSIATRVQHGIDKGHILVELHGERLQGRFSFVKFKTDEKSDTWLFFKNKDEQDDGAEMQTTQPASSVLTKLKRKVKNLPRFTAKTPKPMLASRSDEPFSSEEWLYEIKYDGYRMLATTGEGAKLISRNGKDYSDKFPNITHDLQQLNYNAVMDGEVVIQDSDGRSDFSALQRFLRDGKGEPLFYVFDLLSYERADLTALPLLERKAMLAKLLGEGRVRYADHVERDGEQLFEKVREHQLEGVIAKRKDSDYQQGKRTTDWLKLKADQAMTVTIVGYTLKKGTRTQIGSLAVAKSDGKELHYLGKVGTGFSSETAKDLHTKLKALSRKTPPVADPPQEDIHWVTPKLYASVTYSELTDEGSIRHGVYHGLADKPIQSKSKRQQLVMHTDTEDVPISNPEKLLFPGPAYTKADVVKYYESVAPLLLPHLKDRPITMHRFPNGIEQEGFFHKDLEHHPDWVKTYTVHSGSADRDMRYLLINDTASLLYAAQLGTIELHPWHSHKGSINKPDWVILDLDPHGVSWKDVVTTAKVSKQILDTLDVPCVVKTSGFVGMHIGIPLAARYSYTQALDFMKILQRIIFDELPDLTAIVRNPDKRPNRLYLDILQNARGQTIVAPYSLRPGADAPVSTPLQWDEVKPSITPDKFTLKTTSDRFADTGDLWEPILGDGIDLEQVLNNVDKNFTVS